MLAPHDVLALDVAVGEVRGEPRRRRRRRRRASSGAVPSTRASDVTPRSAMPHGTMCVEHREVGVDVEREAVTGAAARDLHADRGDLLVTDPDARVAAARGARRPEVGERVDEHAFERAHVRHDVAQPVAPVGQRDDRVADQLPGPVVRDVAAAIGAHERRHRRAPAAPARARVGASSRACTRAGARAAAGSRRSARSWSARWSWSPSRVRNATEPPRRGASVELGFPVARARARPASRRGTRPRRRRRTRGGPR